MTFADHGVQGGVLYALPAHIARAPWWVQVPLFCWGFWRGMKPDADGFFAGFRFVFYSGEGGWHLEIHFKYDWAVYARRHHDPGWNKYEPAYLLHLLVDRPFHQAPGVNWWPTMWQLASAYWLLEVWVICAMFWPWR